MGALGLWAGAWLVLFVFVGCGGEEQRSLDQHRDAVEAKADNAFDCGQELATCDEGCLVYDFSVVEQAAEACAEAAVTCFEANPEDPATCEAEVIACLDAEAIEEEVGAGLEGCLDDCQEGFWTCMPEDSADYDADIGVDFIDLCLEGNDVCMDACEVDLSAFDWEDIDAVVCDDGLVDDYLDCVDAALENVEVDPEGAAAAAAACETLLDAMCTVPDEPDTSSLDGLSVCYESCGTVVETCIQTGLDELGFGD
jgi:hypothetical protein